MVLRISNIHNIFITSTGAGMFLAGQSQNIAQVFCLLFAILLFCSFPGRFFAAGIVADSPEEAALLEAWRDKSDRGSSLSRLAEKCCQRGL